MVTVIIPTIYRPSLYDSFNSVLEQGEIVSEILIGADVHNEHKEHKKFNNFFRSRFNNTKIIVTGGNKGAGFIRHELSKISTSEWIAYLDDDDIFIAEKLNTQLQNTSQDVISSRFSYIDYSDKTVFSPSPKTLYNESIDITNYLFRCRSLNLGRNVLETSTLVIKSKCLKKVNWNPNLKRHQDWDFIIRLIKAGYKLEHRPEVLSKIRLASNGGVSSSSSWRDSIEWYRSTKKLFTDSSAIDFLIGQALRYAIQSRSLKGVVEILLEAKLKERPSLNAMILALSGIFDRSYINKVLPNLKSR